MQTKCSQLPCRPIHMQSTPASRVLLSHVRHVIDCCSGRASAFRQSTEITYPIFPCKKLGPAVQYDGCPQSSCGCQIAASRPPAQHRRCVSSSHAASRWSRFPSFRDASYPRWPCRVASASNASARKNQIRTRTLHKSPLAIMSMVSRCSGSSTDCGHCSTTAAQACIRRSIYVCTSCMHSTVRCSTTSTSSPCNKCRARLPAESVSRPVSSPTRPWT